MALSNLLNRIDISEAQLNNYQLKKISFSFEEIIDLYVFDRQLRLLIFDGIEKIEIALRTQIIYNFSLAHGSFWHLKPENRL